MRLGVGVVTYDRLQSLKEVVEAVETHTDCDFDFVVADDGSADGTADFLAERGITRIGGSNRGIAWNKNRALYTLMQHTEADILIMLEDDTVPVRPGWQGEWMRAAELHGYVTYAHPKIRSGILEGSGTALDPYACTKITSQCAAVSRRAVDVVGYFDTRFRGYGIEDGEWTTRLRDAGFGVRRVATDDGLVKTNLMLGEGVAVLDVKSYRNNAEVARNRQIFDEIRNDPIPRMPWSNDEERSLLEQEVRTALNEAPLADRSGRAGVLAS